MTILREQISQRSRAWAAALAVLAALGWSGWSSLPAPGLDDPRDTASAFLEDLAAGRFESAYARTSTELQGCYSAEQFRAALEQASSLWQAEPVRTRESDVITSRDWTDDSGARCYRVQMQKGSARVALKLRVEAGQWKVCSCIVLASKVEESPCSAGVIFPNG
jgi:hypothetical protein